MEEGSDLGIELKTSQYNVNRISRLVNMYHAFHHDTGGQEEREKQGELERVNLPARSFLCPKCQKRMWSSIETYRVHKSHCKKDSSGSGRGRDEEAQRHCCGDCQASFSTSQEYRTHVRPLPGSQDLHSQHTWVCPYHCGNGKYLSNSILDFNLHSTGCPIKNGVL